MFEGTSVVVKADVRRVVDKFYHILNGVFEPQRACHIAKAESILKLSCS